MTLVRRPAVIAAGRRTSIQREGGVAELHIRLLLFGQYARYLPPGAERGAAVLEAPSGTTVMSLLDSVGLPATDRHYVTINGGRVKDDVALEDGDEVRVIVPLGGG
jgi:sulfur carrier protein ThiS